jgi:uracil-DNA glycosylase
MEIMLIGEAWGEHEARQRTAFVGPTGYLLNSMLTEVGIRRADCYLTNVFNLKPHMNKIDFLCGPKEESFPGYPPLDHLREAKRGKYIRREFKSELTRLGAEVQDIKPNVIVCLGNTAMWAMLGKTSIGALRGAVQMSSHTKAGFKVLPTYHPAAIMRQWSLRPLVVLDLMKALRQSQYPDIRRPKRKIWIDPTLEDIYEFDRRYIQPCERLAVDIETAGHLITCIGFAPAPDVALVIPFLDPRRTGRNYWDDPVTYHEAVNLVGTILSRPTPKTFQNGLYDITFIYRAWGIKVRAAEDDTMLLHHALQPESLKGLGFLGSVYTDEAAWKQMRKRKSTIKRED